MTGYRTGLVAEIWVLLHLLLRGYWPCAWRYKTRYGEIDLIVRRGRVVVCVEVKYRRTADGALYALQPRQIARLRRAADHFQAQHHWAQALDIRLDLAAVSGWGRIVHLDNIGE